MINIGKDTKSDTDSYLDDSRSRAVLICGKRGSGKSYTLGVIIEELIEAGDALTIILDPMGIYHPMSLPNEAQERELWDWGLSAKGLPVRLLTPGDPEQRYGGREVVAELERRKVRISPLRLNPSDLSPDSWCGLFDLGLTTLWELHFIEQCKA